jgi:hypothetical protein
MQPLSAEQWQTLANALAREVTRVAGWTNHNAHDPGAVVLELLAYALTELTYRTDTLDVNGRALARRVAQLADSLAGLTATGDCPPGLQRVNYFTGGLLGAADLTAEQDYIRAKLHRRNRVLHGAGVVTGLHVSLERSGSNARVVIAPGLAFSPRGEEVEVSVPASIPLPARGTSLLVLLHYAEQLCRPVPALATDPQAEPEAAYSRITETFNATLAPVTDDTAVALAHVTFARGRWTLDRKFKAAKVRV